LQVIVGNLGSVVEKQTEAERGTESVVLTLEKFYHRLVFNKPVTIFAL
jgi:hypothetical protein